MLKNFDTEVDEQVATRVTITQPVAMVTETITAKPVDKPVKQNAAAYLTKPDNEWTWKDLRDYVVAEIEARFGAIPHETNKETGIFKSFFDRWGPKASVIARYSFDIADGRWRGAPISPTRFCKGSDPYFAQVIIDRLEAITN